ncbi:anthranilate synthase component II [Victivallis vadensis]|uniref:Anthranilate synthase component II n=1 Tax=Victivallis vadensis TaxID=172901 RepID=A0A2U1ACL9_9BACT|nr:aminodeoxychorismate/anthranilate synthase component II [Victivallis vadensis]NMD85334.1 aminodeoxychorismate/anthranilate synthase component II [Victivallis vadensis]PVY33328.1 anthranilate synthase component II [Victivallis vadensis]PWM82554.1 MAG: aminodeoxychorismate/anthranilate synthase component II [Lentisphaerota bacterium]PWM82557.1 MAG: aminodeoxychorismate/anthranilate synthase component II [Lentisphaerota bacterium]
MIFVLDNFDSFTYNLVQYFQQLDRTVKVVRNNAAAVEEVLGLRPEAIVLSPGPGRPENAGIMPALIRAAAGKVPMFGVCLGHQAIGQAFGMQVIHAKRIMHGKVSTVDHDGRGLFTGLSSPFKAVRYHSLALDETTLPPELEVTARSEDGEVMGIRHKEALIEGIQYHPESILTSTGKRQLANFLELVNARRLGR